MSGEHPRSLQRLLPVLVYIQARLHGDLSLAALAAEASMSPHHFHRVFRGLTGETPKQYCRRLRLERAAFQLLVYRGGSIFDTALDCGFKNHETFTRAFGRHFGVSPREYRDGNRRPATRESKTQIGDAHDGFGLSETRVRELDDIPVAFIRHVGPHEDVGAALWERLLAFSGERGWTRQAPVTILGIAHDAPGLTPPERLRFDIAIRTPHPFTGSGEVGSQIVRGGIYGVTTHVGHFSTLHSAYRTTFERLAGLRRYRIVGLPAIEIYHSTSIGELYELGHTDVCIPLELA